MRTFERLKIAYNLSFSPAEVDGENDVAVIMESSGTTGKPKGICLTHAMLWCNVERYVEPLYLQDNILLYFTPIGGSGLHHILTGTIHQFTRVITTDGVTPQLMLHIIEKYDVSFAFIWPLLLSLALKSKEIATTNLSSLKYVICGSDRVSQYIRNEFPRFIPNAELIVGYGMTETGVIAINYPYAGVHAIGQLHCFAKAKIVDKCGNRLGVGEIGEICVKKLFLFVGYYEKPEKTREMFDKEGFILTGDMGYFDENGYLYIIERKAYYSKFHENPILRELEEFLLSQSTIKLSFVTTVANDALVAVVSRNENSRITEADVLDMVSKKFNGKQYLNGGVYFNDSVPAVVPIKILRREMQTLAEKLYNNAAVTANNK